MSVSTLRRRIKKDEIVFIKKDGKYLLPDMDYDHLFGADSESIAPPTETMLSQIEKPESLQNIAPSQNDDPGSGFFQAQLPNRNFVDEGTSDQSELKKAYAMVLNEKEEQILQLKQHIVDLQTLNKALENELDRLSEEKDFNFKKTSFVKHSF